ncbi:MAG: PAS domain S-box protein [Planctomycetes bacterium]|nr:PAS domain S-box protein [Planctomycetota bacterium]
MAKGMDAAPRDSLEDVGTAEERLALVLDHSTDAIILVDAANKIRLFNKAASEIFGYASEEILNRDYDVLLPPELRASGEAERVRRLIEKGETGQEEECLRWSKEGKPVALKARWAPVRSSPANPISLFSFIRDQRPIKRLREELVRAQSLAMVGELAATVAHEVRNPLASIQAALENLKAELKPNPVQDDVFRKILDQIQRLDHTVESLLVFAKPWEVQAREYDLSALIQSTIHAIGREPEARGLRLEANVYAPCPVEGDPQLVEQVLVNVLRNAVQATPAGGTVSVQISVTDHAVELVVRDTGPGIPPEHLSKIFHPFFTTKARGTGLGLATCQKMLHAHRGRIQIGNAAGGGGAEVVIKLPRVYRERA